MNANRTSGLTLIELLITLAVFSILIAVAYPSYSHYLAKTHRLQAEQGLYMLARDMQQYHQQHHSYIDLKLNDLPHYQKLSQQYYHYQITELTEDSFQLASVPTKQQANHDYCGTLLLDNVGEHQVTGKSSAKECWTS